MGMKQEKRGHDHNTSKILTLLGTGLDSNTREIHVQITVFLSSTPRLTFLLFFSCVRNFEDVNSQNKQADNVRYLRP